MTIETHVQDKTRPARGNQINPINSSDYANGSQDIAGVKGSNTSSKRQRCFRATFTWADSAVISFSISGKLARQLSKSLESQLTESVSAHELSIANTAKYEQKITELKEELKSLKQLIKQLEEAERHIQETEVEQLE
jgi:uncharacterized membrane protein YgaE (UPF0421/DUF939 family)